MARPDRGRPRVLLAEDDADLRHALQLILTHRFGAKVTAVADGHGALEHLRHRHADVVLADLRMPRMDGAALLDQVAARWPGVPCALMSAGPSELLERRRAFGGLAFEKPMEVDHWLAVLARVLALACAPDRHRHPFSRPGRVPGPWPAASRWSPPG